jgi:uncharacterized protein
VITGLPAPVTATLRPSRTLLVTAAWVRAKVPLALVMLVTTPVAAWAWGGVHLLTGGLVTVLGLFAGAVGAVVGFGTAAAIPCLIALGVPPVIASVTTTLGLLPGSISAALASRTKMRGRFRALLPWVAAIAVGSVAGAALLVVLPASSFRVVAVIVTALSLPLVLLQEPITQWAQQHQARRAAVTDTTGTAIEEADALLSAVAIGSAGGAAEATDSADAMTDRRPSELAAMFAVGLLGGYWSGALGLIVLSTLVLLAGSQNLRTLNAIKVLLVSACNGVAAVEFLILAALHKTTVAWGIVLVLAISSLIGGVVGVWLSDRMTKTALRVVIVIVAGLGLLWMVRSLIV